MYALGVSFLLATSNAFAPLGGRVQTRMGKLSMSTVASPVATEAILATVSFIFFSAIEDFSEMKPSKTSVSERIFNRALFFFRSLTRLPEMLVASPLTLSQR